MSNRRSIISSLLLTLAFCAAPGMLRAQERPAAPLLRDWLNSQREAMRGVSSVSFVETAVQVQEGPFGPRRLEVTSLVTGDPPADEWHAEALAVVLNGRQVDPERWKQLEHHRRMMLGMLMDRMRHNLTFTPRLLGQMRIVGPARADTAGGARTWRLELASAENRPPVDRVIMWLNREDGRLHRLRLVLLPPRGQTELVVVTEYRRVAELDVPLRRAVEGAIQTPRRMRTFTMMFSLDATYDDYRLTRR